jgi:hypothetical protein
VKVSSLRTIVIHVHVWNTDVIVFIGGTAKQRDKVLERERVPADTRAFWSERMESTNFGYGQLGALTMFSEATPWHAYVYFPATPRKTVEGISQVTHEMLHVAIAILRRKDIPLVRETEEAYTYLTEHLVRLLWEALA